MYFECVTCPINVHLSALRPDHSPRSVGIWRTNNNDHINTLLSAVSLPAVVEETSVPTSVPRQYLPHRRATSEAANSLTLAERRSHGRTNSAICLGLNGCLRTKILEIFISLTEND